MKIDFTKDELNNAKKAIAKWLKRKKMNHEQRRNRTS